MLIFTCASGRRGETWSEGEDQRADRAAMALDLGLKGSVEMMSTHEFFGAGRVAGGEAQKKKRARPAHAHTQAAGSSQDESSGKGEKRVRSSSDRPKQQQDEMVDVDVHVEGELRGKTVDVAKLERTIFVGGVPLAEEGRLINPKTIKSLFRDCGEIESVRLRSLPVDNPVLPKKAAIAMGQINAKRQTCNAFVVFKSTDSVAAALRKDGDCFGDEGHRIRVDAAKAPGDRIPPQNLRLSVFVGNVPFTAEEEALRNHFSPCGAITNVRIVRDSKTLVGKGFAFVAFGDCDGVRNAMDLNGSNLAGSSRALRITRCSKKASPEQQGDGRAVRAGKDAKKPNGARGNVGAERRRRYQRDHEVAAAGDAGKASKRKMLAPKGGQSAKVRKKDYLKIEKTPKFKQRKDKRNLKSKGEARKAKQRKGIKKAKKALQAKKRKV